MPLQSNQRLEIPPEDEVSPARDALTESRGMEAEPDAACDSRAVRGRVLLLDDDSTFREILRDWLVENGYDVVSVQSGGDGVREVLANDFTLVLCDVQMPGLPGDVFYRAVERIRPDLCRRFVFMTGHQHDAKTDEFIKSINGFVLAKPFRMEDLLDSIAVAEVVGTFQSVSKIAATDPVLSRGGFSTGGFLRSEDSGLSQKVARILARAEAMAVDEPPRDAPTDGGSRPRGNTITGLALFSVLAAALWIRYSGLRERIAAAEAERLSLDAEWTVVSRDLQDAATTQSKIDEARRQLAAVSADRARPRWAPALRSFVPNALTGIQLHEVRAREEASDPNRWTLMVGGVATGAAPGTIADRYRLNVERNLTRTFASGVTVVLERFDELPDPEPADGDARKGTFTIAATIRLDGQAEPKSKEGE